MRLRSFPLALAAMVSLSACCAQDLTDTTKADNFAARVASSDKLEIKSSELALQKSSALEVRNVAENLLQDHEKSSQELMAVLNAEHEDQPPTEMISYHQSLWKQLQSSTDFDCDYLNAQWVTHRQAIALFDSYSSYGDDEQLRTFALQTLPTLINHLHMVEDAENASRCSPHFQPPAPVSATPAPRKHHHSKPSTDTDGATPSTKD